MVAALCVSTSSFLTPGARSTIRNAVPVLSKTPRLLMTAGPVSGGVQAVIGDAVTVSALDPDDQVAGFQNEARPRPADW
jgi:hypothetical protein